MQTNMEEPDLRVHVSRTVAAIQAVSSRVRELELPELRQPGWSLPDEQLKSTWAKRAHWLYVFPKPIMQAIPTPHGAVATLAVLASVFFSPFFLSAPFILGRQFWTLRTLTFPPVMIGTLLAALSVFATYWSIYETAGNRALPKWLRAAILLVTVGGLLVWVWQDAPLVWESRLFSARDTSAMLVLLEANLTYRILAAILLYVPLIHLAVLALAKVLVGLWNIIWVFVVWAIRVQIPVFTDKLSAFVTTPMVLWSDAPPVALVDLDESWLNMLKAWADSRRQTVGNRLIPMTLLLAVLAIATDAIGQSMATWMGLQLNRFFVAPPTDASSPNLLEWVGFMLLVVVLITPVMIVGELLSQSYVADYVHEASVLALQVRQLHQAIQSHTRPQRPGRPASGLIRFVTWLMGTAGRKQPSERSRSGS